MRTVFATVLAFTLVIVFGAAAFADDWVVVRLRGSVLQHVDGEWIKLKRGGVVPDSRIIRTLKTGNVEFERGNESVTIGPNTQIQIFDEETVKPFTTVKQYFGTVTVEAEVRQVQHFAVQTPYLAAVVKGTKFVVTSGDTGASVDVKRGRVFVEDKSSNKSVTISAGQSAAVNKGSNDVVVDGESDGAESKSRSASDGDADALNKDADNGTSSGIRVGVSAGGVSAGVDVGGVSAGVSLGGSGGGNTNGGSLLNINLGPIRLGL